MRRRNSRSRVEDAQHGAAHREEDARGPPPRRDDGRRSGERLELGVADRRLDALLEDERSRAASMPAQPGVRRLEVSGRGQEPQPSQPARDGRGVPDALSDPRAEALGLGALQDAVRHSFGLLQQALGRPAPQQGLLGPLLDGDVSGQGREVVPNTGGGQLLYAAATSGGSLRARGAEGERSGHREGRDSAGHEPLRTPRSGQPDRQGVEPRVLEPYGTPAQSGGQAVNPFWSAGVQQAAQAQGDHGATNGHRDAQSFEAEMEKLKAKCLREAEEAFAREVKKLGMAEKTEAESYHTAASSQGMQRLPNGSGGARADGPAQGASQGPGPPPGLTTVRIGFDGTVGPTVSESLRHLELPTLPVVGSDGAALQFGDWMTMAFPLMSDLGMSAKGWWERSVAAAEDFYGRWLESTPLERLRLKPQVQVDPGYMRLEQRGISMLLGILPEALRRDVVGARNVSTVSILYRLFVVFQPGGGAERTSLLKSHYDPRCAWDDLSLEEMGVQSFGVEGGHSGPFDFDAGSWKDVGCRGKDWRRTGSLPIGISSPGASS